MPAGEGTVAYAEVDGAPFIGINSRAPGYTDADRAAADQMRDTLFGEVSRCDGDRQHRSDA
jgi:hypothetical protein